MKKNIKNKRAQNPLYVVTNKGQDVQTAKSRLDALVKKMGVEGFVIFVGSLLDNLWRKLWSMVNDYTSFMSIKNVWDDLLKRLERLINRIDPLLAFTLFTTK